MEQLSQTSCWSKTFPVIRQFSDEVLFDMGAMLIVSKETQALLEKSKSATLRSKLKSKSVQLVQAKTTSAEEAPRKHRKVLEHELTTVGKKWMKELNTQLGEALRLQF